MKRNRMFMWAYIAFVFIMVIFRVYNECTEQTEPRLWTAIVISITVSSIPFDYEDLFCTLSGSYKNTIAHNIRMQNDVDKLYKKEEEHSKKIEALIVRYPLIRESFSDMVEHQEQNRKSMEDANFILNYLRANYMRYQKAIFWFDKLESVFAYVGFLFLFVFLIISEYSKPSFFLQEIITVVSFMVILWTKEMSVWLEEKNKKVQFETETQLKALKENEKINLEYEQRLDDHVHTLED